MKKINWSEFKTELRAHWKSSLAFGAAIFIVSSLVLSAGCSMFGTNPSAPTKIESYAYNTQTNWVPVTVTNFATNVIVSTVTTQVTNTASQVIWQTNQTTNVVVTSTLGTNLQAQYTETVKPGVTAAVQTGGTILNTLFPGVGSLIMNGVLALLGGYGYLRSSKNGNTATAMSQEIETILEFVGGLPNGSGYVSAIQNFLQAHQAEAGVTTQVLNILQNDISNNDAKTAAQQIAQFIQTLSSLPPAPTPVGQPPTPAAAPKTS